MISWLLEQRLRPAVIRHRRVALLWRLAAAWGIIALVAFGLVAFRPFTGLSAVLAAAVLALTALFTSFALWLRHQRRAVNLSEVARALEARYPELQGLLLTAVQLPAGDLADTNFLQRRVLRDAVAHAGRHDWTDLVPPGRRWRARAAVTGGLVALVVSLGLLATLPAGSRRPSLIALGLPGVEVTPGDVRLEKGQSLVVLARFGGTPPAGADLVLAGPEGEQRLPLVRSLSDPVFGGSVAEVATNFAYRVEYAGKRTRDFAVTVFEHPRLERADVDLNFPAYTGRAPRRIEDTRRITAVEGTEAALALRLNKPVAAATLVPRGTNLPALTLATASNVPAATLNPLRLAASATYDLRLVDAEGRTNKLPATFVVEALPNRAPELRLTSPRGDVRPSPLEEISFTGSVWDDFGVIRYGLAWTRVGGGTQVLELGAGAAAEERRAFEHTLRLEDLGVAPDDLLAWHLWAEDIGPDGQPRRTEGDLFFAEVRPFDEIFRESEGGGGEDMAGGEGGGGGRPGRLTELQKQIINATWRLHRQQGGGGAPEAPVPAVPPARGSSRYLPRPGPAASFAQVMGQRPAPEMERVPGGRGTGRTARPPAAVPPPTGRYKDDLAVVRAAAQQALDQARETMQRQQDPRTLATWAEAIQHLETSLTQLERAERTPAALAEALVTQQSAYQALLKLQARETAVTRGQQRGQGGGGENSMTQRQIDQLDLRQSENRYETRRQAQSPQDEQRREELALQNRLQELARRQEDVNQRLQELQTALQEARSEREREELRRELKRLQEEQQRMLADLDEMQQRMSRPENQSRLAEQRQQLEQAREDLQRAAEAAGQGQVSQALASGTRAQQQLQELRDQMRRQSSSQFAEELRELRAEARELARRQEEISRQLAGGPAEPADQPPPRRSLGDRPAEEQAVEQLAQQAQRLTNLVARATQLSQEAEPSEPLVTRQLYDALRQFSQDDAGAVKETREELLRRGRLTREFNDRLQAMAEGDGARAVDLTAELLRRGLEPQARDAAQRARAGVETLRRGVERAADSVLGDDTEALRLAEASLEELAAAVERELASATGATNAPAAGGGQPGDPSGRADSSEPSAPSRAGQPQDAGEPRLADRGDSPGEGQSGGSPQDGDGTQPQPGGPGGGERPATATATAAAGGRQGGSPRGGGDPGEGRQRGGFNLAELFNEEAGRGGGGSGPITGEDFAPWADRLRDVEDMVDDPVWRTRLTGARERARVLRLEQRRDLKKPDWAVVQLEVLRPLVEVRDALRQELARRSADTELAPLDRDPVPDRYSDLVRRYYEELGRAH